MRKEPIFLCGPTASGKTALAVELALRLNGEIVSADSMQIYRHMQIGTAAPTEEEQCGVPHHMIGVVEPQESFSVERYRAMALPVIRDIQERGRFPIVAGGTGLYFDALMQGDGYAPVEADLQYRRELNELAEREGNQAVHDLLAAEDPETAARLHPNNLKRVIRALEVLRLTGRSISDHDRETQTLASPFAPVKLGINIEPRERLYARIDLRVDRMLDAGLLQEAESIQNLGVPADATAMQAIGYKELIPVLHGETSLADAVALIKQRSRNYAKRQLTWFRRDAAIRWYSPSAAETAADLAERILRENTELK